MGIPESQRSSGNGCEKNDIYHNDINISYQGEPMEIMKDTASTAVTSGVSYSIITILCIYIYVLLFFTVGIKEVR